MLHIADVLDARELTEIRRQVGEGRWVDGRWTAGGPAAEAKQNQILEISGDGIDQIAVNALVRNALFDAYVLPWRFAPPQVARYEPGMSYGSHVDSALMGRSPRMRCDLSITVFLSEPGDYEGGELVIDHPGGASRTKLPAGSAAVYPADTLHRVDPVRRGERLVIVTWAQSHIRDHQIRQMLFDLGRAIERLEREGAKGEPLLGLIKTHANLYRKFAET